MEGGKKVSLCHVLADQKIVSLQKTNAFWGILLGDSAKPVC